MSDGPSLPKWQAQDVERKVKRDGVESFCTSYVSPDRVQSPHIREAMARVRTAVDDFHAAIRCAKEEGE